MKNKFKIRLCSDLDYEEMVADVCYENCTFATITQEKGVNNMEIEIFLPENDLSSWKFSLEDLVNILQSAKQSLIEIRRLPEE